MSAGDPRKERARAVADFAAELRALRASAGTPPFREMAAHSRAISHTTLHEAAQGHRLPSWSTTVEFAKACGADPEDLRGRWEAANRVVRGAAQAAPPGDDAALAPDMVRDGSRRRYAALGTLVAAAVAATVIGTTLLTGTAGNGADRPPDAHAERRVTSADCPVRQRNPPPAPPRHRGDRAAFVSDITLPDCTHVPRGGTVTKVWRFKNTGSVGWYGYSLHRIDLPQRRDQCQTIVDVPIPDTPPGRLVDIRAQVTAPPVPGFCFVRFKMLDGAGNVAFPGNRPVNFQVVVD
ncbi:NBR1-Ig-like domain-containing protein [Actinomadura madurae]|uniref:NBR1-Ig-like domain-containing protein n=1 Tax=Actinomadura madurae TaxID=1993 RepID=UPI0020262C4B|nr:NBR1-Ig-like domain-containing protein [Actinomadura madurae]URM92938.1 NBR1-Ig-like domain-containing protein [Actinomadura madurae]